jgi:hypothetical protein
MPASGMPASAVERDGQVQGGGGRRGQDVLPLVRDALPPNLVSPIGKVELQFAVRPYASPPISVSPPTGR